MNILWAMEVLVFVLVGWQQRVEYSIDARLNTDAHTLFAVERVTYHNASPHTLDTLFFHLYANAYRDTNTTYAREAAIMDDDWLLHSQDEDRGRIDVTRVLCDNQEHAFRSESTLLVIPLPSSLLPGDSVAVAIQFTLVFPKFFSRLGYEGEHYEVVQWYPKVCVLDDDGWHLDTYHALGEFYGEYATFDVRIDLPAHHVIAATGTRVDHDESAFTNEQTGGETAPASVDRQEVHFHASEVHDFAWVCDPDYRIEHYEIDGIAVDVYFLEQHEKKWLGAGDYARDAIAQFSSWYGPYPYKNLSIAENSTPGGMEYPMLVLIGSGEDRFTRMFEIILVHELAHQWFYGAVGNNELDEAWLDEGFASYSEMRYLEDKYGDDGWLFKVPFPLQPSRRYFHQLVYYVMRTNGLEKSVRTPAYDFVNTPIAYENSAYAKPALFLKYLEGFLGRDTFDVILKKYYLDHRLQHVTSEDFIAVCEEESGQDLAALFENFLSTTDHCDWSVQEVDDRRVYIKNNGSFNLPVDVLVQTETGPWVRHIGADCDTVTFTVPEGMGNVKSVTIDPAGYAFEPDRWNNHYPRKVLVRPFFGIPSFDAYQVFVLPYLWYSSYDGVKVGLYFLGSEFVDFGFLKGRHQWFAGGNFGMRSELFYPTYSYQTPLVFNRDRRIRVFLEGSNSRDRDNFNVGLHSDFGTPLSSERLTMYESALKIQEMKAYLATDSIDWELGTNVTLVNTVGIERGRWSAECAISYAHRLLGSDWDFLKVTGEVTYRSRIPIPFTARLFMGRIAGTAPRQEQFFLSGALRITPIADIIFDQSGYWSPQEHIHIPGDGNMRGYQMMHIKTDGMVCMNLELLTHFPVRVFADIGYYERMAFDVGCRLVLGPLSLNVPFYTLTDDPWEFRWSIGLP